MICYEQLLESSPLPGAQGWVTCCILCYAEGSCIPFTPPGSASRARLSLADVRLRPMLIRQPCPISIKAGREPSSRRPGRLGVVQQTHELDIHAVRRPLLAVETAQSSGCKQICLTSFATPTRLSNANHSGTINQHAWLWRRMTPPKLPPCPRAAQKRSLANSVV